MILWRLSLYYTFTASTDSALPTDLLLPPLPMLRVEDMTIMPSSFHGMWPRKLTSFIIPLAEDPTRLEAELAVFFLKTKKLWVWGWGFLGVWVFGVFCVVFQRWAPKVYQLPQVEREDSARGIGGVGASCPQQLYMISKSVRVKLCQMVPVLDVFLSVGLWFHTSRVLWKMLRLTLFRDCHYVKSWAGQSWLN